MEVYQNQERKKVVLMTETKPSHGVTIKGLLVGAFVSLLTSATIVVFAHWSLVDATRWGWWVFFVYLTYEWLWRGSGKTSALRFFGSYERRAIVNSYLLVALMGAALASIYWLLINRIYDAGLKVASVSIPTPMSSPTPTPVPSPTIEQLLAAIEARNPKPISPNVAQNLPSATPSAPTPTPQLPRIGSGPDAYKDVDDLTVGQWAMDEADKISEMADNCLKEISAVRKLGSTGDGPRWHFTNDYDKCCAQDVADLRSEILRRLGPPAKSVDEQNAWDVVSTPRMQGMLNPGLIQYYAPQLRLLGLKLKRRAKPRAHPITVPFSEMILEPNKPDTYRLLVTVETKAEIDSGYLVVEFDEKYAGAGTDFVGSKLMYGPNAPLVDNKDLTNYLATRIGTTYVLVIGQNPLLPGHPIHVEAFSGKRFHVARVLLFDE